jgi:ATP-dependent DNA helicase 2 subunit 1
MSCHQSKLAVDELSIQAVSLSLNFSMLPPMQRFRGKSWLEVSVTVASAVLRTKVLEGAADKVSVVFYNCRAKKNKKDLNGVYVKHSMAFPDAGRVVQLKNFSLKDFEQNIGAGSSDTVARSDALDNSLVIAGTFLPGLQKKTTAYIVQRVVIFTRDAAPGFLNVSMKGQAELIAVKGGLLQLAPLYGPDEGFNLKQFWGEFLSHAADSLLNAGGYSEEGEEEKLGYEEQHAGNVLSLESLSAIVRMRAYRKRAIARMNWTLGPGGAAIAVKLYQTIKTVWPQVVKGSATKIDPIDNKPLLKAKPTTLDTDTGIALEQRHNPRRYLPKGQRPDAKMPLAYAEDSEVKQLKYPAPKGLSLLGFKPLEDLKPWHQLREASFIFPDEKIMSGSLVVFSSMLSAMVERRVMAVCAFVRNPTAAPRLVALVPQEEVVSEETSAIITSSGMHMYYLPHDEEIRYPELDTGFTGTERPQPSETAVEAAAELVTALDLGDDFDAADSANPHAQHWLKIVEEKAIALEAEGADGGGSDNEGSDEEDYEKIVLDTPGGEMKAEDLAMPDAEAFASVDDLVDRLITEVAGNGNEMTLMGQRYQGKKRAAATDAPKLTEEKAAALGGIDFAGKFAAGRLGTLKNNELKLYCECYGLRKGGNKAELVARVTDHLEVQVNDFKISKSNQICDDDIYVE